MTSTRTPLHQWRLSIGVVALSLSVPLLGVGESVAAAPPEGADTYYLSDLSTIGTPQNGHGPFERDRSNGEQGGSDGLALTLGGVVYAKGLGVHAASELRYDLDDCSTFVARVGVDDEVGDQGSVEFKAYADDTLVYDSGLMTGTTATKVVDVAITGADQLRLVVTGGGDGPAFDHGDWADAAVECGSETGVPVAFGPAATLSSGSKTHGVGLADLDGDDHLDLVSANAGASTLSVRLGDGAGGFGSKSDYATDSTPKAAAIGDVTGDGRPDLVSANQDAATVSVLRALAGGGFATKVDYPACAGTHEVALGDIDGDTDLDVVAACWGGSVMSVLRNNGSGVLSTKVDYATGENPHSVVLGRFDGDADLDVAVADHGSSSLSVLSGNGNGTFAARVVYPVGDGPHSLRTADLNGDGDLDLVSANDGTDNISVLRGTGNGTFAAAVNYPTGLTPKGVAIADVSGDGALDVVTANIAGSYPTCCQPGSNTVSVLLGTGTGAFERPSATLTVGLAPFSIATGDIDEDGDIDLATANYHSDDVSTLRNLTNLAPEPSQVRYVSDLPTIATPDNGFGPVERDRSNGEQGAADGVPITLAGVAYAKGLGTHAASDLRFELDGDCSGFSAQVGIDDEVGDNGSAVFEVWVDGTRIHRTAALTGASAAVALQLPIPSGAQQLRLVATNGGDNNNHDHADWGDAKLTCDGPPTNQTRYLSDLPTTGATDNGFGPFERDRSNGEQGAADGAPIALAGVAYAKGLGTHAASDLRFDLGGDCSSFSARVGIDDEVGENGSVVFEVYADGVRIRQTGVVTGQTPTIALDLPIPPATQQLRLVVTNAGDNSNHDHADWGDAKVTCAGPPPN